MAPGRASRSIGLHALVLTVLCWPVPTLRPDVGVDASWQAGLHMAAGSDLVFGRDLIFTYGPLGFLNVPRLYFVGTLALVLAFAAALTWAVAATVLYLLRRSLRPLPAFGLAFVIVKLVPLEAGELFPIVIVMWCLIAALDAEPRWLAATLPAVLGLVASAALLVKFSGGLAAVAAALIAGAARSRRALLVTAVGAAAGLLALWLATGGPLGALPRFFAESWEVARGYSEALGIVSLRNAPLDFLVVALLYAAIVGVAYLRTGRGHAVPALLIVLVLLALEFKHGFVRHDGGHIASLLVTCMLVPLVWWRPNVPNRAVAVIVAVAAMFLYVSAVAYDDRTVGDIGAQMNPARSTAAFARHAQTVVSPGRARHASASARAEIVDRLAVDDVTQSLLARSHCARRSHRDVDRLGARPAVATCTRAPELLRLHRSPRRPQCRRP